MIRIQQLKLPLLHTRDELFEKAAKVLRLSKEEIVSWKVVRQSLDARKKPQLLYVYTLNLQVRDERKIPKKVYNNNIMSINPVSYNIKEDRVQDLGFRPVIVGSGPSGLFCAYALAKGGYAPLVIEQGDAVDIRTEKVADFWKHGMLDRMSNVQFGEGGAGTFSDGKLNTSVKDPDGAQRKVLELLVGAGAPEEILYQQKPHLGTDLLIGILKNLRQQIESMGGTFWFRAQMTELLMDKQEVVGVMLKDGRVIDTRIVVCAIGHSSRDTFQSLYKQGIHMSEKAFAVGVRIEHAQSMINCSQYGKEQVEGLGAASYKLTHTLPSGLGVYSFCMCPGGYVVNASSEEGALAINGMSYHKRDSTNANSAMIVTVSPEDYRSASTLHGPPELSGVAFQRGLEKAAFSLEGGRIPVQLFGDFVRHRPSHTLGQISPCMKGAWALSDLHECLPENLCTDLIEGIQALDKRIPGFAADDALISGVESRSSSPVRIHRNQNLESNIQGFFPCGEGAGYAGGISSAAMDGLRIARACMKKHW